MITGRQIRAARTLLDWKASDLAEKAGLTREAVSRIESGTAQAREGSLEKIMRVFDTHRIEFLDNQGVRFKPNGVDIYDGQDRFGDFYEFLYEHLRKNGGEVCLSIYDETLLAKNRRDPQLHRQRMQELTKRGDISFRILTTVSDFVAFDYAKFRYMKQPPNPTGFYAFGGCLALVSFAKSNSPYIVLLESGPLAEAYRQGFNIAWDNAEIKPPPTIMGAKE